MADTEATKDGKPKRLRSRFANRVCDNCGAPMKLTLEAGADPFPETLAAMPEGQTTFSGYAEHWDCGDHCGSPGEVKQIPVDVAPVSFGPAQPHKEDGE